MTEEEYQETHAYIGGIALTFVAGEQQEAHNTPGRKYEAEREAAQKEILERLAAIGASGHDRQYRRVNPELMVHGHVKQGEPEPVTIYKSDPVDDDVSELYQTAVQVGDTTRLIDIDFTQPGMSEEILLAIVRDRLVSGHYSSENIRMASHAITAALAYLR